MNSLTALLLFSFLRISIAADTILVNQLLRDGDTISSSGGTFELGFFSPGASKNRYVGIWYKKDSVRTVVWVANREAPVTDSSGVLKVTLQGILVLVNGTNHPFWSSNSSRSAQNPNAQLLENGNLVVRNGNDSDPEKFLWQSFDYPGDTLLPGMKLGWNLVMGLDRHLSSWKSADDPSVGNFTYGIDLNGFPQLLLKNGLAVKFRAGSWNGVRSSGLPQLANNTIYTFDFVSNGKELYLIYFLVSSSVIMRLQLTTDGFARRFVLSMNPNEWSIYSTAQKDDCDNYGTCGANGICRINQSPKCECMKGFKPKFQRNWDMADWLSGCTRRIPLNCSKGDRFMLQSGMKIPDTRTSWFNQSMSLKDCASWCLRNCSCTAYANSDIRAGGSGCLLWFDDLMDVRDYTQNGQDFYVRMSASDSDIFSTTNTSSRNAPPNGNSDKKKKQVMILSMSITGIVLLTVVLTLFTMRRIQKNRKGYFENSSEEGETDDNGDHLGLQLYDLDTLTNATNNFSTENKIGEGGFGPVYKGILPGEQEVAVKVLSKGSRQGLKEFKNEVESTTKLQHRNLVKLLGCCIRGRERMLIYEYLPNKSLDLFIFGQVPGKVPLDWPTRFLIINGIARGLLYLHQDSRHRIIHRDLKAENVLLDNDMNPKISDFGIARSFGGNDAEASTTRVAGTLGYMAPEYASEGLYSTKSDVFSFGVLVLEIISGKRNRGFKHPDHNLNLLGHAWTLYVENRSSEFIDASMENTYNLSEVERLINLGLLCVQRFPDDRLSMQTVVLMLGSEGVLPHPKEPCFFTYKDNMEATGSSYDTKSPITLLEAR